MSDINRVSWHRVVGLVLAAGSGVGVVLMLSVGTAHADPVDAASSSTDPIALLDSATADLTQANDLLSSAEIPTQDQFADLVESQTLFQNSDLQALSSFESIQEPLLSSQDSSVSDLANLLFGGVDQQLARASDALLVADQAFVADPTSATDAFGELVADFQFVSADFNSALPDLGALLFEDLDPAAVSSAGADAAAAVGTVGSDLATSFSPDLFFPF